MSYRIGFRTDATAAVSGGHVMRCLALAGELAGRGCEVVFLSVGESLTVAPALGRSGYQRIPVPSVEAPLDGLGAGRFDTLVIDSYGLSAVHERGYRDHAGTLLVIDDLADRPHDCDLLVDTTYGRLPETYQPLAPDAELLLGADYALQRPAFAVLRPESLKRREAGAPLRRVLVSFGLSDPGGVTAPAARTLMGLDPDLQVDVVVKRTSDAWAALEPLSAADPRLSLYDDPPELAELMAAADLAVGAGGVTSWERCCLGLPTIVSRLAENQRDNVAALTGAGAAFELPDPLDMGAPLTEAFAQLTDPTRRLDMSCRAATLSDGQGARRVADALLAAVSRRTRP